ncbi:MAG: N-acetylglucosamine kinase, partial [Micromonosporaceae bacterium]
MTDVLVLGLDIGGTSSRALLADSHGRRLGTGTAAGGNPTSHHESAAFTAIASAIRDALSGVDPSRVASAAIGMAGVGRLAEPAVREQFEIMWRETGLRCDYQAVGDAVVAFAAGTPEPDGTLLLAGTGAIAAQLRDRDLYRISDGHGWLLGDLGSGFWLGREAVRAVLAHLDGWRPSSALIRQVHRELLGTEPPAPHRDASVAVVNAVRREPPVALARLAQP